MAQVSVKNVFAKMWQNKFKISEHLLSIIAYLAVIYVLVYVRTTNLAFIGTLLFFFLLLPATVLYIEYISLIESGTRPENFRAVIKRLFGNAFRSGRMFHLFSFKTLLVMFLTILVMNTASTVGFSIHAAIFDPNFITMTNELQQLMLAGGSSDQVMELVVNNLSYFDVYIDITQALNEYLVFALLILMLSHNSFKIFADMFIERQPTVPLPSVIKMFFKDKPTKRARFRLEAVGFLIVLGTFTFLFITSFTLVYFLSGANITFAHILLRSELITFALFVPLIPLLIRYNFYSYKLIAETKQIDILRFSIKELDALINNPTVAPNIKQYLTIVKGVREDELARLLKENAERDPASANNQS